MNLATFELLKTADVQDCIVLSSKQIKQLQTVILSIAKDIFDFCEKHDIKVFLGGGSALGAVRHKGFIPWDDDIDLNMPRADYERFIELFPQEYREKYWLHTPERTENYGSLMAKVLLKNTIMRSYGDVGKDECGVFVDIFVIENTYGNRLLRTIHGCGCVVLSGLVSCRRFYRDAPYLMPLFSGQPEIQRVIKLKARIGVLLSWMSMDRWVHLANSWNKMCGDGKSRYVTIPTGRKRFFGEMFLREPYCRAQYVPFEQYTWPVSADVTAYLTRLYGDYMAIPAPEKRERHTLLEFKL